MDTKKKVAGGLLTLAAGLGVVAMQGQEAQANCGYIDCEPSQCWCSSASGTSMACYYDDGRPYTVYDPSCSDC